MDGIDDTTALMDPALRDIVTTRVIDERRRRNEADLFDDATYIGRTFAGRTDNGWGNPIRLRDDTTVGRARCLVDYWRWLQGTTPRAKNVRAAIRNGQLDGTLSCWCTHGPCHGWIIAGLAAGLVEETKAYLAALETTYLQP